MHVMSHRDTGMTFRKRRIAASGSAKAAIADASREAGEYRNALCVIEELFYAKNRSWEERAELMRAAANKSLTRT